MASTHKPRPKPAHRPRYRYVAFALDAPEGVERAAMVKAVRTHLQDHQGMEPWLTRFNGTHGILRVLRGTEQHARHALASLASVRQGGRDLPVSVRTLGTSGSIAALGRKSLRHVDLRK